MSLRSSGLRLLTANSMKQNQSDGVAILKSLWKKNKEGVWAVHDIKAIDLRPREGFEADYFKIKDEMVLLTQRPGPVMRDDSGPRHQRPDR